MRNETPFRSHDELLSELSKTKLDSITNLHTYFLITILKKKNKYTQSYIITKIEFGLKTCQDDLSKRLSSSENLMHYSSLLNELKNHFFCKNDEDKKQRLSKLFSLIYEGNVKGIEELLNLGGLAVINEPLQEDFLVYKKGIYPLSAAILNQGFHEEKIVFAICDLLRESGARLLNNEMNLLIKQDEMSSLHLALLGIPIYESITYQNDNAAFLFFNTDFLTNSIDWKEQFRIPCEWPTQKDQHGPTCGLNALFTALNYGPFDSSLSPPVCKGMKNGPKTSLRKIAKELGASTVGEILNVNDFSKILEKTPINPKNCEAIQGNQDNFIALLCGKIDQGNTLIVSCDLDNRYYRFPGQSNGEHLHWALIFGYFKKNGSLYFLACQYGGYYLWLSDALLLSNQQLKGFAPEVTYIKKDRNWTRLSNNDLTPTPSDKTRRWKCQLEDFRFSLFSVPVSEDRIILSSKNNRI